jgi:hypothetical protein
LTADRLCFNQPGLVIGADGIEINLAGHDLSGGITGLQNGPRGIDNSGGFDDVTVRNGGLPSWGDAFYAVGANRNRILDVAADGRLTAITFRGGDANEVRRSELLGTTVGLLATDSAHFVVAGSEANALSGPGIFVLNGDLARIVRNRVARVSGPDPSAAGIELTDSDGGRIAENVVSGPWSFGGIYVDGSNHVVVDNKVTGGALPTNASAPSGGDGLFVFRVLEGTIVLRRNDVRLNEGDGIEVSSGGARLQDNTAVNNGDIGIDAASGTIDLGGNFAVGNSGTPQCRNVFCQ